MTHSSSLTTGALLALGVAASGQSTLTPTRVTAPIKDRGIYHLATGTWSRANPSSGFSSDVLFNNTATRGYFFSTTAGFNTVDHGRIPSTTSPATPDSVTGTVDAYTIDCFQIGYCSSILASAGGVDVALLFYDNYAPCSDVDVGGGLATAARFTASGLPGATPAGAQGCWMVAFDLSNTTTTFVLGGDADGAWDDDPNTDSFGWGLDFTNATGGSTGPLIAGNCPLGGVTLPQRGFQTAFGGVAGATDSTGLGTNDFFWIDSPPLGCSMSSNGGCFFFGGCTTGATGAALNPFGGYWLQLFGDKGGIVPPGTAFCSSIINASGSRAILRASGTDPNADLTLSVTGLPNSTGQLFFGTMGFTTPGTAMLGDGPLCAAMGVVRINPFLSAGMMMQPPNAVSLSINYTAPYAASLTGTRYFQHWYRSTLPTGTGSNGSSGIKITF